MRSQRFILCSQTLLQWLFFLCFRWHLLFIKVRRGPQTPTAVTGSNDYVRLSACAPRQQRRTSHYPAVLSGRYLLYHMDYVCHLYRSAVSQTSPSTLWNSDCGIVNKESIGRKRREIVSKGSQIPRPFTPTFEACLVTQFWKRKQNRSLRLLFLHGYEIMHNCQPVVSFSKGAPRLLSWTFMKQLLCAKWLNRVQLNSFGLDATLVI